MNKKLIIIAIMILLCPIVWAQKQIDRSQELKIGQVMPDIPIQPVLNYKQSYIDINSFRDKVVILDFFDTFCVNCIAAMPKLQKLQNELGDKLQVILVTWQDQKTIEKFFQTNSFLKENKVSLSTIYSADLLRSYFPHTGVPHTAWIYRNKVQAVTYSDFVIKDNVEALYKNGAIQLPLKSDFNDGLSVVKNEMEQNQVLGSLKISGYEDGVETTGIQIATDSITGLQKTTFYNLDILGAYTAAWSKIKKPTFLLKNDRIVWNVKDSSKYQYVKGDVGKNMWLLKNGITYERIDQIRRLDSAQAKIMLHDLNAFFGLNVYWTKKELPCLVIKHLKSKHKDPIRLESEGGVEGTDVLAFMIDYQGNFPPIIDEAGAKMNIQIDDYSSLEKLNQQLKPYDLVIIKEKRPIEVLLFEEIK
ncbi:MULTISPECIES: TlpA family protein disulfide reductase [Sphingobacterium]|uniref:TlpA family protein disulfide reductase n=1 Tax=Sphingobacterium TaxID=28453 RepID=UPI00104355ED|nr:MULTISPECIES: TlpA disulfide reductase family protein [Sphingobacterium]MCW2258690.1 thiol-disulfide isomerase/thioredoxin [Sphingobacterium kitahiroshimense]TCR14854.1 AhpC/TSA family protein [Sphingobacterium sp. JUb78]